MGNENLVGRKDEEAEMGNGWFWVLGGWRVDAQDPWSSGSGDSKWPTSTGIVQRHQTFQAQTDWLHAAFHGRPFCPFLCRKPLRWRHWVCFATCPYHPIFQQLVTIKTNSLFVYDKIQHQPICLNEAKFELFVNFTKFGID